MRSFLLALLLPLGAAAAAELPVTAVTLSSAGLAEIERRGPLPGAEPIRFRAPVDAVDDILRTLILRDPAGRVAGFSLPGQDLQTEAFRDLPVKPGDFASRIALLQALRGQMVTAGGTTGRLADAEASPDGLRLTLVGPEGLRLLRLAEGEQVRLADATLAARLDRAAAMLAASREADSREIEIVLTGADTTREVSFSYLAGAPVWKPSWRLILPAEPGPARLQGWAVVENRTGADWRNIHLSLVAGDPAAYRQALYTPLEVGRPERPVRLAEPLDVTADSGPRPLPPAAAAQPPLPYTAAMVAAMVAPAAAAARPAPPAYRPDADQRPEVAAPPLADLPEAAASAVSGRLAYQLPASVSLPAGSTANLPFLDAELPAERLWWLPGPNARHPLNAIRLRNTTTNPLPDGMAALFGPGGFLGDAELRWLPPGESRLLGYARDREITTNVSENRRETPIAVVNRRAAVEVTLLLREETAIALAPGTATGPLVIDLPRRPGAEPRFPVAAEGDFGLRVEATLTGAPMTLRYGWERQQTRRVPLWDGALGEPLRLDWRNVDLEGGYAGLPGGPRALNQLTTLLRDWPATAPGRPGLERTIALLQDARQKLDAARAAVARAGVGQVALERARQAAEDRSGPAREDARRQLNTASLAAEEAGRAADAAWLAWRGAVEAVLTRPEG